MNAPDLNTLAAIRQRIFKATQAEFAAIAGTSQGTVSRWETDELKPTLKQLSSIREEALRRGLGWKDEWFFEHPATEDAA